MPARYAILSLLYQQPMHGYDVDSAFEKGLRRICHVNISQIYAYLKSMEAQGWVESEVIYQESSPPKKVFHLTELGKHELDRWLRQPETGDRQIRDRLLTRLFFILQIAPEELPALLDQQIEIQRSTMEDVERHLASTEQFMDRMLAEAGVRHARADLEWLLWLREEVARLPECNPVAAE